MKSKKRSKKNRKKIQRKPGFVIFAEKLMENLKLLNEINECPNCKSVIENNEKICPKCGTELKTKTIEENMDYIRSYLQDVSYTQNLIIEGQANKIKELIKIIRENNLEEFFPDILELFQRYLPELRDPFSPPPGIFRETY